MTIYGNNASKSLQDKLTYWTTRKNALQNQINNAKATIATLSQDTGENLDLLLNAKIPEKVKIDALVQQTEMRLNAAKASMPTTNVAAPKDGPISDQTMRVIAAADPLFRQHLAEKRRADFNVGKLLRIYGAKHRMALDAVAEREALDAELQKEARIFLSSNAGVRFNLNGEAAAVTPAELEQLQTSYDNLKALQERERLAIQAIARQRSDIREQQDKIEQAQNDMAEASRTFDALQAQQQLANQVNVLSDGNTPPGPSVDKRKKYAVAGFLGGAMFPLALMMLYGIFDDRYRYSDEAGGELSGITLLGILPNLPDRLSDPEQATTAAHCVHQIRTMLQINQPAGEPQAIAVTSATSGDGKTSLTLALGLSYAACGTRVLLIDCDLVGAGLTHRMDIDSEEGVLEAIANRGLLEYMRTTDINDVAIIPVGSSQDHHASTLSPQALRRLIVEAKEHFDVILIDTGPILGSIEASLVCTAVDGVVLAVARRGSRLL
jgi:hypothetical protein